MPTSLTTVPDVLLALIALGNTVLGSSGVTVLDGGPDEDNLPNEFLSIGWSRDEDESSVDGGLSDEGNYTSSESYAVHCILSVATGDQDSAAVVTRRARLASLFSVFGIALRADPMLSGTLTAGARAFLGNVSWIYGPALDGTYAEIEFDVNVTAYYLGMP
jgi:hypothetical protein